jgi:hypothetical protein
MLKKILSLVLNCEKKGDRKTGETSTGGTEEPISSMDTRRTKEEIPDPWYQKSEYY